jgi:hypothetical protein
MTLGHFGNFGEIFLTILNKNRGDQIQEPLSSSQSGVSLKRWVVLDDTSEQ